MSKLKQLLNELCPDGVKFVPLSEVAKITAGGDVPKDRFSRERTEQYKIPIWSNGIGENALYGYTDTPKITERCITIAARGTIGYCELRTEPFFPIIRLICAVPNREIITADYLKYVVETITFAVPASGIPQLTVPMVGKYKIPLPPLPVQGEIVRILDNFAELTAGLTAELTARKKQYEYYRDYLLTFEKAATQPLADRQARWVTLGEIATDIYRGSGIRRDQVTESGTPCVRYGEIYTTYGIWFDKCVSHTNESGKHFEYGDILFAITGESVEEIAKSTVYVGYERCLAGGDIVVLKHNQNPKYLSYALSTAAAQAQKSKGRIKSKVVHSSIPAISGIQVPLPSLDEQARIVEILDKFDALTTDITTGLPAEIAARQKQYKYYRDKLLAFKEVS